MIAYEFRQGEQAGGRCRWWAAVRSSHLAAHLPTNPLAAQFCQSRVKCEIGCHSSHSISRDSDGGGFSFSTSSWLKSREKSVFK